MRDKAAAGRARRAGRGAAVLAIAAAAAMAVAPVRHGAADLMKRGGRAMGLNWTRLRAIRHAGLAVAALGPAASAAGAPVSAGPVPPMQLGLNLATPVWWDQERSFANLAIGAIWQKQVPKGWEDGSPSEVAPDGAILAVPAGGLLQRMLTAPVTGPGGAVIRCRFAGDGTIVGGGVVTDVQNGAREIRFRWTNRWSTPAWVTATAVAPGGRLSPIDCREPAMPADALYDPAFVQAMKPFRVLRFKDWQLIDANAPVRWADRNRPGGIDAIVRDGVPIEDMMALVAETGADPWFCMPWNADADYVRGFAKLVHDRLPPGRKVYVELGNEVWNWSYPVTHQAMEEGKAARLTGNGADAVLLRYAQKTVEVMGPWERAFADRPGALVRVVATQHGQPRSAELVLGFPGLAAHVDALATAPYFALGMKPEPGDATLDRFFRDADAAIDPIITDAIALKAIAHRFGKRYISYEAGQHIVLADIPTQQRIQRDPRMYGLYRHYVAAWQARVGDVLGLFHSASPIDGSGAWGLIEHSGQPLAETPKLRAVLDAQPR